MLFVGLNCSIHTIVFYYFSLGIGIVGLESSD